MRGWLRLYQSSYKRPINKIEIHKLVDRGHTLSGRSDRRTRRSNGAAGYFCEEWRGQPTEKGPVGFSPPLAVLLVSTRTARLWTLGAGHSDNCSSIAVYPLVLCWLKRRPSGVNEGARQNDCRLTGPHLTELNWKTETASGAETVCLPIVRQ